MEEFYQEMREFSKELKKQAEEKFHENKIDSREKYIKIKELEKQDKSYNTDLETENFYLAIKLLLLNLD